MDLGDCTNGQADGFLEYLYMIMLCSGSAIKPWFNTLNSNQVYKMRSQIAKPYQN